MKKLLIAAAAMAVVAGAQAQSSVTAYGILDYGYTETSNQNAAANVVKQRTTGSAGASASNRLGFKATEDLGGGLKGEAVIEFNVSSAGASSDALGGATASAAARQTYVQVSSATAGTVAAGYVYTAQHGTRAAFNAWGGNTPGNLAVDVGYVAATKADTGTGQTYASGSAATAAMMGDAGNFYDVRANAVAYTLPSLVNGLTISAGAFTSDKQTTTTGTAKSGNNGTQFQVMYKQGMLDLGAAMTNTDNASTANEGGNYKSQTIGASYDLGVAKLMVVRTIDEFKSDVAAANANNYKRTVNQAGVRVPVGKTTLIASYAKGEHEIGATPTGRDLQGLILAADYAFSKRTSAYISYGKAESEESATFTGVDKQTSIGLRHSF